MIARPRDNPSAFPEWGANRNVGRSILRSRCRDSQSVGMLFILNSRHLAPVGYLLLGGIASTAIELLLLLVAASGFLAGAV